MASDAIENLKNYAMDATNHVEEVFTDALQLKELKRKLLNVVVGNFDLGSEKYDAAYFRIMVEEVVNKVEFPVFSISVTDSMDSIAGKFTGEITASGKRNELVTALEHAISRVYEELCAALTKSVKDFKEEINKRGKAIENSLLENITHEFEILVAQCENKEKEISTYKAYVEVLEEQLTGLR